MFVLYVSTLLILTASVNGEISCSSFNEHSIDAEKKTSKNNDNELDSFEHDFNSDDDNLTPGLSIIKDENAPGAWNYEKKNEWPKLFPTCGGDSQSPININTNSTQSRKTTRCLKWHNYNRPLKYLILENTGHSLKASSSFYDFRSPPRIWGGVLHDDSYILDSIHWHWGDGCSWGSEHTINSKRFPLEMHLVHYNSKYKDVAEATASNNKDALVVVATFYELSDYLDEGILLITEAMMSATDNGEQDAYLPLDELVETFKDGYYTYYGSLTTPACNQVVKWIVSTKTQELEMEELNVFQSLLVNGKPIRNNYRSVQPLNKRKVKYITGCKI